MKQIRHIMDLVNFMQLPKDLREITFYSEGGNYWPHLEGLVKTLLETTDKHICYITSGDDDPGLLLEHKNFHTFKTDEGFVRNWLFENIETDIMIMTMPDLNQFQVKRSKHKVHYIYVQHSLVSLHMIYRKGAFDHYDTIFCAGPHHVKEIRAMERKYNLPAKNLVEHGYGRLDAILEETKTRPHKIKYKNEPLHILLAPSWGPNGTIESGVGENIVDKLIAMHYRLTFRPHPQTVKLAKRKVESIVKKHKSNDMFNYESNVSGQDSLHKSDVMISDWSGAALDYAFGLNKPIWFVDAPKKINNEDYMELEIEPFEVYIREEIGTILNSESNNFQFKKYELNSSLFIFNVASSAKAGSNYIRNLSNQK